MPTPILMPRQGQSVESCILNEWLVQPGEAITEGQPIASIETDKATFEVEAPEAGTLLAVFFEEGDDIPVLTTIAAVGTEGEDASALAPDGAGAPGESAEPAPVDVPVSTPAPVAAPVPAAPAVSGNGAAVGVSPRARQTAAAKGVDPSSVAGSGPGGRVIERDVLAVAAQRPGMSAAAMAGAAAGAAVPAVGSGPGGRILSSDLNTAPAAPSNVAATAGRAGSTGSLCLSASGRQAAIFCYPGS